MEQHVGGVVVDPERSGSLELLGAVAAREEPDAERSVENASFPYVRLWTDC